MSSCNLFASPDADAAQPPAHVRANPTLHSKYSSQMMRKMALASEVSFGPSTPMYSHSRDWETTDANKTTKNKDDNNISNSGTAEELESAPAEPIKTEKLATDYEALKKAKKAAKKLRQKIKKGKVMQGDLSQGDNEAVKGAEGTLADASGNIAAHTAGRAAQAATSEVGLINSDKVQPGSTKEEHIAVAEIAAIKNAETKGHQPTKSNTSTAIQLNPPVEIVVPRKNTLANKRKKENAKKAKQVKQAEKKAEIQEARDQEWMMGLGGVFLLCMASWVMYMYFSRG
ncbi:hypothetical protein SLS60_010911 [Paraconiothyrium brasiliense]|uniref:Uncharacterized protein n=1 Tax=Paraconiothyrium brasiliense TaxID=300254 RepID=A0ABR3QMB8_9PLEO